MSFFLGVEPMLSISISDPEAIAMVRKRCRALSRVLGASHPYKVGEKLLAVVDPSGKRRPFASLTVKTLRPMRSHEMTEELAKAEGYSSLDGWRASMVSRYGSSAAEDGFSFFRIGVDVDKMLTEKLNAGKDSSEPSKAEEIYRIEPAEDGSTGVSRSGR
jgi:hypothetical protein